MEPNTTGGELTLFSSYGSNKTEKAPVVAVEFDTFRNEWDPHFSHVGFDVGFIRSEQVLAWDPFKGSTSVTANAQISFDANSRALSAIFSEENGDGSDRKLLRMVNLTETLPEKVSIGFAGGTGFYFQRHIINSWSFRSSLEIDDAMVNTTSGGAAPDPATSSGKKRNGAAVAGGLAVAVTVIVGALTWLIVRRRRAVREKKETGINDEELEEGKGPRSFSYSELARATRNFSQDQKLGRGGFGDVYKGILSEPAVAVAVKRVAKESRQGKKEYLAEVKIISRVRHRNLVKLVGWCHEKGELLLVYEYMPNGSLDAHLYGKAPLPWPTRCNVVQGVAHALMYLHEEWEQCVIHRDVKSSNVMLDSGFNAKLGDFGLSRLVEHDGGMETTAVAGTMGYLAPETATTGRASKESDVYSFGVLALEIACGRRPIDAENRDGKFSLVERVWDLYGKGAVVEAADERLGGDFDRGQMERLLVVGLWCAHPSYLERPTMGKVIGVLTFDMPLPNLPPQLPVAGYDGVSFTGINLASMHGWSSSASGGSAGYNTGSSVDSGGKTSSKPLLSPYVR